MIRSPLPNRRQDSDEIPLTPKAEEAIPEIFSTRKKVYALSPAYTLDTHRSSEIPHNDLDYWPRDAASRRLFHQNRCEECDCDCTSDGCSGCLRRNKQCLYTATVFLLTIGVVLLLFSSLSYNLTRKYSDPPTERHHFSFHHHFYNTTSEDIFRSVNESTKPKYRRVSIPIIEDERDPDSFWPEVEKYLTKEGYKYLRKKRSVDEEMPKNYNNFWAKQALKDKQYKFINILQELNDIEEALNEYRNRIEVDPRTVFEPFSLAYSTSISPDSDEGARNFIEEVKTTEKIYPSSLSTTSIPDDYKSSTSQHLSSTSVDEEGTMKTVEILASEESTTTEPDFTEFETISPSTGFATDSSITELVPKSSEEEFISPRLATDESSSSTFKNNEEFTQEETTTTESMTETTDKELLTWNQTVSSTTDDPLEGREDQFGVTFKEIEEETTFTVSEMEESSTTTSEAPFDATFDSYEEKLFEERSEKLLHKTSSTTTIKTTTAFYETSSEEDETEITTTITPELPTTTLSEDDSDESVTVIAPRGKVTEITPTPPKMEGISLAEAKKRKKNSKKKSLLNSRVVGGTSDVKIPTGPDVVKPFTNAFESIKTSQQLSFTPSAMSQYIVPYQICFYANPSTKGKPTIRDSSARTFPIPSPMMYQSQPQYDPYNKQMYRFPPNQQNFFSINVNNYPNPPSVQPHFQDHPNTYQVPSQQQLAQMLNDSPQPHQSPQAPQTAPLFCTFLQPPLYQFPSVPGTAEFHNRRNSDINENYLDELMGSKEVVFSGKGITCYEGTVSCRDGSSCIPANQWCDNKVQCKDASDEMFCSCRERVGSAKLCDGYFDCPNGEDETGCFDCPKSSFSCNSFDTPESCIPLSKRCDNVRDCPNGKDEIDCTGLFNHVYGNTTYHVSYVKGYLHRNWRGEWLPVCVELGDENKWAKEACFNELGALSGDVDVSLAQVPESYRGQFLVHKEDGSIVQQEHCKGHVATYVKCPELLCGTRVTTPLEEEEDFVHRFRRYIEHPGNNKKIPYDDKEFVEGWNVVKEEIKQKFHVNDVIGKIELIGGDRNKREETGRVVGGKDSVAKAWPWVIALYKDGYFHCGGVILDEKWVMTAAHCMDSYNMHHFEVRAGLLRRFSFSPMEQTRPVADVIVHEKYDRNIMNNDVALLRLQRPLYFNRWVRPACLPHLSDGTREALWGPLPGTTCIAVGWGAIRENGIDPDQMREVEVPILAQCKHKEDVDGHEICAGVAEGGKDTCQGDSGGPLLCRDSSSIASWYVAGIVSHGEGCARPNEPGAYTRVSLFIDWITANSNEFILPTIKPLAACPGLRCSSGSKRCIPKKSICNGFVDCIDAEDEKNCEAKLTDPLWMITDVKSAFAKSAEVEKIEKKIPEIVSTTTQLPATSEPIVISSNKFMCKGLAQSISNKYVCDGVIDCEDGTDEIDCKCRDFLEKIKPEAICDGYVDCKDLSDEENCEDDKDKIALSMNPELYVGKSQDPERAREGNLMKKENGTWTLVCDEEEYSPVDVCTQIGLSGYLLYGQKKVENCSGLYVTCMEQVTSNLKYYEIGEKDYFWPWNANVYADGEKICTAVLLEPGNWLLTSEACADNLSLSKNLILAELGARRGESDASTIIRIDDIIQVPNSDMILLHLESTPNITSTIHPLTLENIESIDFSRQRKCIALGEDHTFLKRVKDCPDPATDHLCYHKIEKSKECDNTRPWIGVIVCQSEFSWFPASVFHEEKGSCGFEHASYANIQDKVFEIQTAMKNPIGNVSDIKCDGFRCRNGRCITSDKVCDDSFDCPSREDENFEKCSIKSGCKPGELKCRNGKCIPKILYGNGLDDCGDKSDEPDNVTCSDYLKLTAPERLCDGRRNCFDKSDEVPGICPCSHLTYNCTKSGVCISKDFLCDGEKDCPNGEDEASCVGFQRHGLKDAEITHYSFGRSHSICSPNITQEQADKVCRKLGLGEPGEITTQLEIPSYPELDPFFNIALNRKTKIKMRGNRPFVSLIEGDEPCETVIVKCK